MIIMSNEKIEEIKKKVSQRGLWISRVPLDTKQEFKQFSNDYYESDYGMAFKAIFEAFKQNNTLELLAMKVIELEDRLIELSSEDKPKLKK